MSSMTLYNQIRKSNRRDVEASKLFEMPYVVRLHNKHIFGGNAHEIVLLYRTWIIDFVIRSENFLEVSIAYNVENMMTKCPFISVRKKVNQCLHLPTRRQLQTAWIISDNIRDSNGKYLKIIYAMASLGILNLFFTKEPLFQSILTLIRKECSGKHPVIFLESTFNCLFSWYPVYFPFEQCLNLKVGDKLVIDIWRCGSDHYRWYEWRVVSPLPSRLYNMDGTGSKIGCNS